MRTHRQNKSLVMAIGLALSFAGAASATGADAADPVPDPQSRTSGDSSQDADPSSSAKELKRVTVTANLSHIDRPDYESPTPVVPIAAAALNLSTTLNVGAALNELPYFQASNTPQTGGTTGGASYQRMNLRGLGNVETLVLMDRHRFIGSMDMNTIPSILIDNVQVVTGGSSAAWGSGAVSGVVNIQLDRQFTGLKANLTGGTSTYGDGTQKQLDVAYGADYANGKGHFLAGVEYMDSLGVYPRTARPGLGSYDVFSYNGHTRIQQIAWSGNAVGGLINSGVLKGSVFAPGGTLQAQKFEYGDVNGSLMHGGTNDGNYYAFWEHMMAPVKRYSAIVSTSYELPHETTVSFDLQTFGSWGSYRYFVDPISNRTIHIENPFLDPGIRDTLQAAGEDSFLFGRTNVDMEPWMHLNRRIVEYTASIDGLVSGSWHWDAYVTHGESRARAEEPGFLLADNIANALDVVSDPVTGAPVCRTTLTMANSGCVPINLFGQGAPSAEAIAYVTGAPSSYSRQQLDAFSATMNGNALTLPAGPVQAAVGINWRREALNTTVSQDDLDRAFLTINATPAKGAFTVREMFGELQVPLLKDVPAAKDLQLNVAGRASTYSTAGTIRSWKIGLVDEIFDGFRLRAGRSRDIRAPNINELFNGVTSGFNPYYDPISDSTNVIIVHSGGNPDLRAETGFTSTVGFLYSPPGIPSLTIGVDHFDITINDVISSIGAQAILNRCGLGNQAMCDLVHRDANGIPVTISSPVMNLNILKTNGVDLDVQYTKPLSIFGASGTWMNRLMSTWVHTYTRNDGVSTTEGVASTGRGFGIPRWRGLLTSNFVTGRFMFGGSANYIAAGKFDANNRRIENNKIGSYIYFNLNGSVKLDSRGLFSVFARVENVFNRHAPMASEFSSNYSVMGRYYSLGVRLEM